MVDAPVSGTGGGNSVQVRVLFWALREVSREWYLFLFVVSTQCLIFCFFNNVRYCMYQNSVYICSVIVK